MNVYVNDNLFESNQLFGSTVSEATSNWIASLFNPFETTRASSQIINLYTGCFINNSDRVDADKFNPKINGQLSIVEYKNNSITISWNKTATITNKLEITCDSRWKDIGNFYLDFSTYTNLLPSNLVCPQLFHLSSFNLKIVPWEQSALLDNYSDPKVPYLTSNILANGYYTLGYDESLKRNKFAFKGVNNIEKVVSKETWAYLISQKVPSTNNAMELVAHKFPYVVKNNYQYFDLDSINRIIIEELKWQKGACSYEQEDASKIKFLRDIYSKENYFRAPLEIDYSYKDFKKKLDSKGFIDYYEKNVTGMKVKLKPIQLIWDGQVITEVLKDRANQNCELNFTILQTSIQHMCYLGKELKLSTIKEEDMAIINKALYEEIFLKNKYHIEIEKVPIKRPVFNTRLNRGDTSRSVARSLKRSVTKNDYDDSFLDPNDFMEKRMRSNH